jgi:hypothetical protein
MFVRVRQLASISLILLLTACATVRTTPPGEPGGPGPTPSEPRGDGSAADAFPPADRDGYRPPARLAVLLPTTGPVAGAGTSVRDGLLAAYYGEPRRKPEIRFYDTGSTPSGAVAALDAAVADGAQLVLGPLTRDEVGAVFARGPVAVPVIALNRGPRPPTRGSASFALAPDDEGIAAAERLVQRGARGNAVAYVQRDDNSQRALAAFKARFTELGGRVVHERNVEEATPELAAQVAQDVATFAPDGVFLALKAEQARAVVGALRGSPAAAKPRVSTSLVLNGASERKDVALDGTEYPELPWLLGVGGSIPSPGEVRLGSARGPSQRLFAFGADAWSLVAWYQQLWNPGFSLGGATGRLFLDSRGQVQHAPAWAEFSGGRGRLAARPTEPAPGH